MKIGTITEEIKKNHPEVYEKFKQDVAFHIGSMVSLARMKTGMTQAELAKKINTKQPAIARIESGSSLPSLAVLDKMAKKAFDSYLVPPRFAFMEPDPLFQEEKEDGITGIISGTLNRKASPYSFSFPSKSFVLKAENNTIKHVTVLKNN